MAIEVPNNSDVQTKEQPQLPLSDLDLIRGKISERLKFDALDALPHPMTGVLNSVQIRQYRIEDPEWQRNLRNGLFVDKTAIWNNHERRDYKNGDLMPVWNEKWVPDSSTLILVNDLDKEGWQLVLAGSAHDWDMQPDTLHRLEQAFGKENVRMQMYGATTLRGDEPLPFVLFFLKKNIAQ